ncbi:RidA family protein [Vibrio quintilis]|uniref:Enamine/imine deaminase n=1 Tax=Vibrio quintilis TaxID=1117707 RepID=A0A1M7YUD5_9VIBR|nr:RidA family protein [Vibrio quintilis]SHO56280.1 Enamine/imine deaminase [Vibrio quintilis]
MTQRINYEFLPQIAGPYVHAVRHSNTLYVSGLTAYGTAAQSLSLPEQCQEILQQISQILAAESCSKSDLVKLTIFVKDISQLPQMRELLFEFYEGHLPACSLVEVSALIHPDLQIEIEAVAALNLY